MPKFFTSKKFVTDSSLKIEGEDVGHISRVLRMSAGDEISVCDGEGFDYDAKITEINKDFVSADILRKYESKSEPSLKVTLFQSLPKQGKMEYIIQKNVELGVFEIVPVYTERCVVKPTDKTERWNKVSLSAAKQSGRGIVPEIKDTVSFSEALSVMSGFDLAIMPYECETDVSLKDVLKNKGYKNVAVLIGPEGGFSEYEVQKAKEYGIKTVTLGKRILRTETAGQAVLPVVMYENDEM